MRQAVRAGLALFAIAFGLGFVLGTARVLLLASMLGPVAAVLLELPVILTALWYASRWLAHRLSVPATTAPRLLMGLTAFALLMSIEGLIDRWGVGLSLADILAKAATLHGALGLAGQITFAFIPLVQARLVSSRTP